MTGSPVVAAFDVDGTLTRRDCVVPFLRRVRGNARLVGRMAAQAPALGPALLGRDRDRLKQIATAAAFEGMAIDHVGAEGRSFVTERVVGWLRDDTVGRLAWHRSEGHEVVLVSASYEVYLVHLAAHLGADEVLATRLEEVDGRCTGMLLGANCRGLEKRHRLYEYLDRRFGGRAGIELWAYGDSSGDRDLLADADHPVWARDQLASVVPRV